MRHQPIVSSRARFSTGAFTLVELMTVIAIVSILTALLVPALSKARSRAQNVACLNNLKGLQLCLHFYGADFNDALVPNNSMAIFTTLGPRNPLLNIQGPSWLPDNDGARELDPSNIVNGLLYQYSQSLRIYHCPADQSTLETATGQPLMQLRWRSYNLSQSVNGYPQGSPRYYGLLPAWTKFGEVRHPRPSDLFAFIDENPQTMTDAKFDNPPIGSPNFLPNEWWDMPSDRHSQGANLTFLDGHVEHWKWVYPKVALGLGQHVAPQEMQDYQRIQAAMRQLTDN